MFQYRHKVYFNETNAVGGVTYFSNYVKWQGIAREAYFVNTVSSWKNIVNFIQAGKLNMITVEEHSYFIKHSFFGDEILIDLMTTNIKKFSFDMIFFMKTAISCDLIYEGMQRLAFDDFKGNFIPIPDEMLQSIKLHLIPMSTLLTSRARFFYNLEEPVRGAE